jgi:hypothetical protein
MVSKSVSVGKPPIPAYHPGGVWRTVESPFPPEPADGDDRYAPYGRIGSWGDVVAGQASLTLYHAADDRFLCEVILCDCVWPILVSGLPGLVEILSTLLPLVEVSERLEEAEERRQDEHRRRGGK